MTWIGLSDRQARRFCRRGLGMDRRESTPPEDGPGAILPRGTLLIEASVTGDDRPDPLLRYDHKTQPANRHLHVDAIPGGGVSFVMGFGTETRHAAIRHGGEGRTETLRITYMWDMALHWARLAVERPGGIRVFATEIDAPLPLLVADLHALIMSPDTASPGRAYVALSDTIEPLGPSPGLSANAPIITDLGPRRTGDIRRGDTLPGPAPGQSSPVLFAVRRRVPARGSFRPIRLRSPYFGLRQDVIVAPTQRLVLTGSDVEYTFGCESVLVPAGHLVNGTAALPEPCGPVTEYVQLLMPSHEGLHVGGTTLESLYIGRLRRNPEALNASILQHVPRRSLPEHAQPAHPVIDAFEANALARMRAA